AQEISSMKRVAIALVHHPVVDRAGAVITTAITNMDLHDLARSACTYGVTDVFVVHPVAAQRELATRVKEHWVGGSGARRIPTREPALSLLRIVASLDEAYEALGGRRAIDVWVTTANGEGRESTSFRVARKRLLGEGTTLVLFGTGWGLSAGALD